MADWLAGRLIGSQEAVRNEKMKVIKAIMGIGTLVPSVCVVRQNFNIGEGGGIYIFQAASIGSPGSQIFCRTAVCNRMKVCWIPSRNNIDNV
jgi:DNA polymerase II small subunit/DNA polymerase delta subunit B